MSVDAIIVAAGMGERLGAGRPKAFVEVAGVPMVVHAVRAFAAATAIDRIIVVVPPGQSCSALFADDVTVVGGGVTRQESVSNGLDACRPEARVVAVHDAARPLITPALIDRAVAALVPPWDAVAPGEPLVDTLKLVDQRQVVLRTVDRRGVWAVQTPQVCARAALERVHARVASGADAATDDLSLIERAGGRVRLIDGERRNFKITHAEDLRLAEQILRAPVAAE